MSKPIRIELPELHERQQEIRDFPARFKVIAIGRQWGKSFLAKIECLYRAIVLGQTVWWVAPSYPTAAPHWRELKRMVQGTPLVKTKQEHSRYLEFQSGGSISVKSAENPDNLRGSSLDFVIFDEAAFMSSTVWFEVVMGSLMAKPDSEVWFISTPDGKNWFYDLFQLGYEEMLTRFKNPLKPTQAELKTLKKSGDKMRWACWQLPSITSPFVDQATVEEARKTMRATTFKRELEASFEDTGGGVFVGVSKVLVNDMEEQPISDHQYSFGVDWGKTNDFTVVSVVDITEARQVKLYRFNTIGYEAQVDDIVKIMELWKPVKTYVESNNIGAVTFELLKSRASHRVIGLYTTNFSKVPMIDKLALLIERGEISLLNTKTDEGRQQNTELSAFEEVRTRQGRISYQGGRGEHDDCVMALALSVTPLKVRSGSGGNVHYTPNPFYKIDFV